MNESITDTVTLPRTLEQQRAEFASRRLIAMPVAGTIAWLVVGVASIFLASYRAALVLFVATGLIAYLGMFISRYTGEDFLSRERPSNTFDALFFHTVAMSLLVYAIAIPFFLTDHTSLPLTVGVLTGLMWVPLSWTIRHWVGIFHAVTRTVLLVALWYLFPQQRFIAIPFAIVAIYLVTIVILELRWRKLQA
jgi:hypothetical protein